MSKNLFKEVDITITIVLLILCILFVIVSPLNETPVRILFGLPVVLFLPGYSLVGVLFPRKNDLSLIERIAVSFVLSLAIVPLLGFVLNSTRFGIRSIPVLFVLSTFTISLSLIAWVKRLRLPAEEQFRFPFDWLLKINLGQSVLEKSLSIILIASIMGSFTTLFYVMVTPWTGERFTEFYILGPNGTAYDYPKDLKIGEEGKVIIFIINHEYENFNYRLEISFNGSLIYKENIFLIENEKYKIPFTFVAKDKGENQKLEFLLYRYQQIESYRTLHLWINII